MHWPSPFSMPRGSPVSDEAINEDPYGGSYFQGTHHYYSEYPSLGIVEIPDGTQWELVPSV